MSLDLDKQEYSEKTLKGFLLKNVNPTVKDEGVQELNKFLVARVDRFWDEVVVHLQKMDHFDGNKINWYFEIYKEGVDARKIHDTPFTFIRVTEKDIADVVKSFEGKTLPDYLNLGMSYLSNCYSLLSSWTRDKMILRRLEHIYHSENPHEWILAAEKEERGIMSETPELMPGLIQVINNIGVIMSKRV